jgi:cellulose synthase/poly-beta-1,6-N-acetylglucosamine synthase-like glycosyltransferase
MISITEQMIFWICVALLAYIYVGYPLLVYLVGVLFPKKVAVGPFEPKVTILITAFNEEASIRNKLENTLQIEYPREKTEVIVASDGSTDRTDEIVKSFSDRGVRLFRQEGRVGKTETQNNAVKAATGEIILFSDATTTYQKDVFDTILPSFADPKVGCVAGRLVYVDDENTSVGHGLMSYWSYETFLKTAESRATSLIGASGCLYAVRRSAYEPMYPEACSDFLICMSIYRKGLRSVFAPEAVCYEVTNKRAGHELRMRVRVIAQTFTDLWRNRDMLNPLKSGFYGIQLFSHKLMRYSVPFVLVTLFATSAVLSVKTPFFAGILIIQIAFYLLALGGWLVESTGRHLGLVAIPFYFVLANLASAVAFYKFVRGETYTRWEPIRNSR